jgi:tetratricopeptide (TPR) repeat protein
MDRRPPPSPEELQSLTDAFQRDPAGHFVQLGESFLALGRPGDAVEVGARGLQASPNNTDGRLMVGTAMAQLHRWKEAQAELLKVVKLDRNNRAGFRLLGEVLMRRNDYERALPVLQHAQNLNPSDSEILTLVRRARDGQPLDPPAPIPTPRGNIPGTVDDFDDEAPTSMAEAPPPPPRAKLALTPKPALARVELQKKAVVRGGGNTGAAERISAGRDSRSDQGQQFGAVQIHKAPPAENPLAPEGQPAVRPRLIPAEKPKDAAQEGLRVSAAVGEQYLNQLLMGGLLDVPNVRVSQASYDVAPGKRWGRSSARMFIYLFVILGAAGAGSGVWNWYADKQMAAIRDGHLEVARGLIENGDRVELVTAIEQVKLALERDPSNAYTLAVLAEVTAVSTLLHGEFVPAEVQRAIDSAASEISKPADTGYRELLLARSAVTLAELPELEADADGRLQTVRADLGAWLERSPQDHFVRWLLGRALLAAGDRRAAKDAFDKAHAAGAPPGVVIATVDLGNYYLDEGDFDKAMSLFESALARSQNHDLAFAGRSLARSERRVESSEAMADISIGLAQAQGSILTAWKELALASAQYALEDYEAFNEALDKATGPQEPRFLARVGLGRIRQGRIVEAAKVRGAIRNYAADPQKNPLVAALDLELYMARGLPNTALDNIGEQTGLLVNSIRGRALFDTGGKSCDALEVFETSLKDSPEDIELRVWAEASRMLCKKGSDRRKADETLDSLGRKAKTKTARFVHGTALAATGNTALAKDKLEQSIEDVSDAYPNPLAYRSYLALARLEFAEGKNAEALSHLDKSVEHNPGYLPTRDMLGQVLVESDPQKALKNLADVMEAKVASVGAELAYARALVKTGGSKDEAAGAIRRAKERGAGIPALQKAIQDVDPRLFEELQVPVPEAPAE